MYSNAQPLPTAPHLQEYMYHHADRVRHHYNLVAKFEHKLPSSHNPRRFEAKPAQRHTTAILKELDLLIDFAINNSHTFHSPVHMSQTLYFLKTITAGMCPILHSDLVDPDFKDKINQMMVTIYQRITQISNIKYPNILAGIRPTFITYVRTTNYK